MPAQYPSKTALWTGRVLSSLIVLTMLAAGTMSILKPENAVKGTMEAGYPESVMRPLGTTAVVSAILYAVPQTSVLGAILLTGYFGGAVATHVRKGEPQFVIAVVFGVVTWLGLFLRDPRLRELLPWRKPLG
jgi:hypothetical protein